MSGGNGDLVEGGEAAIDMANVLTLRVFVL